ncbi:MerR family transcriptional regulator [Gracilibacillus timonensis]|uniref:MerR family transcriptional regulator n=1 Tax=Gracilibacillus timonensis TaxID=1816696 RepID=UPI00082429B8|nr:MerR family transcriptional regulator [Gracilibacillus timonensis]
MKKETFSISEFANSIGVSVRTLYYYDEKNILKPRRDENTGHRVYEKEDMLQLHKIMTMKFLGMSLDNIKDYMQLDIFNLSFIDTLRMQESKLIKDKEQIDKVLDVIHRTIYLLENEKEVDHDILVSLLASMQNEKKQLELAKGIIKDDVMKKLFPQRAEEKMFFEKEWLTFCKRVKENFGRPADNSEVKQMLTDFYSLILDEVDMDSSKKLTDIFSVDINVKENEERVEAYIQEIERFVPTPFTAEEKTWLEQITTDYMSFLCNQKEREN